MEIEVVDVDEKKERITISVSEDNIYLSFMLGLSEIRMLERLLDKIKKELNLAWIITVEEKIQEVETK